MALTDAQIPRLEAWLTRVLGGRTRIERADRLGGGAIQENLAVDLEIEEGPRAGRHALVLRTDAPSAVAESWDRLQEFALLEVAYKAGLLVPEPWAACADAAVLGRPFALMARVEGEARGVRLIRDPLLAECHDALMAELAQELAKLHRIRPGEVDLPFLPRVEGPANASRIADLRRAFAAMAEPQPVFAWGLRWLERHMAPSAGVQLIHADFRTGNYLVAEGRLAAVLDWEFARWSDPLEDLGWFLARCWRFGRTERHGGGIGAREAFLTAYEAAAGITVDRAAVRHWELFATIRWGLIALQQAARHYSGGEPSLQLALTSHVVPVLEADVLDYVEAIERGRDW